VQTSGGMIPSKTIRIRPDEGLRELRRLVVEKGLDSQFKEARKEEPSLPEPTLDDDQEALVWERAERVLPSDEWEGTEYEDALFWLEYAKRAYREQLQWAILNRSMEIGGDEDVATLRTKLFRW
jgi:hypothetical protein